MFDWWDAVMPEWSAGAGNYAPVVDLSTQLGLTGGTPFAGPMFPSLANLGASLTGSGAFGNLLGGLTSLPTSLLQGLTGGSGGAGGFGGLGGFGGGGGDFSLLGAILGGLAGSQNEPNQVGTQTVVQDVPDWMKGYYQDLFGKTQTQLGNTAPYDFSNARNFLDQTISGNNMVTPQKNPFYGLDNPYLNDVIGQTKAGVSNDILQRFGSGTNPNAFGTTAQQQTFAKELSDAENRLRYQDYGLQAQLGEQDVNRNLQADMFNMGNRMNAAQGMPNFANSMYQAQFAPYAQAGNIYKLNQASQTSQPIYGPSSGYGALSGALTGGSLLGRLF